MRDITLPTHAGEVSDTSEPRRGAARSSTAIPSFWLPRYALFTRLPPAAAANGAGPALHADFKGAHSVHWAGAVMLFALRMCLPLGPVVVWSATLPMRG